MGPVKDMSLRTRLNRDLMKKGLRLLSVPDREARHERLGSRQMRFPSVSTSYKRMGRAKGCRAAEGPSPFWWIAETGMS